MACTSPRLAAQPLLAPRPTLLRRVVVNGGTGVGNGCGSCANGATGVSGIPCLFRSSGGAEVRARGGSNNAQRRGVLVRASVPDSDGKADDYDAVTRKWGLEAGLWNIFKSDNKATGEEGEGGTGGTKLDSAKKLLKVTPSANPPPPRYIWHRSYPGA